MAKAWGTRWSDTINYLNTKFAFDRLGDHIETVVPPTARPAISAELSLGSKGSGTDDKRHALRGLLLCQRTYYSDLWAKRTWDLASYVPDTWALKAGWKALSLAYWGGKSEMDIRAGLAMFVPVHGATRDDLVAAAKAGPPTARSQDELPGNLYVSRADNDVRGAADTCYNGVTAWLVRSGLASMRWLMRDTAPNGEAACNRLFGTGEELWSPDTPFTDASVIPAVGAGYIVHMWKEESLAGGWNGHWVISNGDGRICGVNNGIVNKPDEVVITAYTNNGKLRSQFEGYGGVLMKQVLNDKGFLDLVEITPRKYSRARMAKFDPLTVANLM